MNDEHHPPDPEAVGHETTDAELAPVIKFGVFLTIVCLIVAALMAGLHQFLDRREAAVKAPRYPLAVGRERPLPPPPRLQPYPFTDIKALRAEEDGILHRYAWVDRNAGLVRIPVDRAIELLAERGLPQAPAPESEGESTPAPAPAPATDAAAPAPQGPEGGERR